MTEFVPGFAIVRVDLYLADPEQRVTVKRIVWEQGLAEREVARLNELNSDEQCRYFWQYTRVDERDLT